MEIEDDKVMVDELLPTRMGRGGPRLYGLSGMLSGRLEADRVYRVTVSEVPASWTLDATLVRVNRSNLSVDGVKTLLLSLGVEQGQWFRLRMSPKGRPDEVAVNYYRFSPRMTRKQNVMALANELGLKAGDEVTVDVTLMEE